MTATQADAAVELPLDVRTIANMLPHRYPFLLVDRVTALDPGKRLTGLKNVTINEPFFTGHFPSQPVMPGVLIIEAMAQASGLLALLSAPRREETPPVFYLVKVDKARFSRIVVPGDQLILEVELRRTMRNMSQFRGETLVDGNVVAEAELLCAARRD